MNAIIDTDTLCKGTILLIRVFFPKSEIKKRENTMSTTFPPNTLCKDLCPGLSLSVRSSSKTREKRQRANTSKMASICIPQISPKLFVIEISNFKLQITSSR